MSTNSSAVPSTTVSLPVNSLVKQTVLSMNFDSDSDSDSDFCSYAEPTSDPSLSDAPSTASGSESDDMIRRVPQDEFNEHFNKYAVPGQVQKHKLARKRKVLAQNSNKRGRTRKSKVDKSCKKTPQQRATEFASEGFIVQAGVLWCDGCNTQVRRQSCAIKQHCKTAMHEKNKERKERDAARAAAISSILDFASLPGSLSEETILHRVAVCHAFIDEGVSFETLREPQGKLRTLLEFHRGQLPRNETAQYMKVLLDEEIKKISKEIKDAKDISFSFDGTTEVAELLGVIIRFVCSRGFIHHRCAALNMFEASLNGEDLTRAIVEILLDRYGIPFDNWQYATRDGCPVNGVALHNLAMFNRKLLDLVCWSHSINVAGKVFNVECALATQFMLWWAQLVRRSAATRRLFKEGSYETALRLSNVRWFSSYELFKQLFEHLSVVEGVVRVGNEGVEHPSGALKAHLRGVFDDPAQLRILKLQLSAVVENAQLFVNTCYVLEGDGFLAPLVHDRVSRLQAHYAHLTSGAPRAQRSPLLWTTVIAEEADVAQHNAVFDGLLLKMIPAFNKFLADIDINGRLYTTWIVFRGCRLLNFQFVAAHEVIALSAECQYLVRLPRVPAAALVALRAELDDYQRAAAEYDPEGDLWSFWRHYSLRLPVWYALACNVALIMTSSASVERLFSLYQGRFGKQQQAALEEYKEASIMLHYNNKQRAKYM